MNKPRVRWYNIFCLNVKNQKSVGCARGWLYLNGVASREILFSWCVIGNLLLRRSPTSFLFYFIGLVQDIWFHTIWEMFYAAVNIPRVQESTRLRPLDISISTPRISESGEQSNCNSIFNKKPVYMVKQSIIISHRTNALHPFEKKPN